MSETVIIDEWDSEAQADAWNTGCNVVASILDFDLGQPIQSSTRKQQQDWESCQAVMELIKQWADECRRYGPGRGSEKVEFMQHNFQKISDSLDFLYMSQQTTGAEFNCLVVIPEAKREKLQRLDDEVFQVIVLAMDSKSASHKPMFPPGKK